MQNVNKITNIFARNVFYINIKMSQANVNSKNFINNQHGLCHAHISS